MLNPGPAGLLGPIVERLSPLDGAYDPNLYVRGVLNNFPNRSKGDAQDQLSLLTSEGTVQKFSDSDLSRVLKPAWVSAGAGDWWQKELSSTSKFAIAVHSKVIVIDPCGANPVVMTGSHNFSDRASTANDDNLVIVKGDRALAQAYAVNIMGIYGEYRFRAWRNTPAGQQDKGLKTTDDWLKQRIDAQWLARETAFWLGV
jgi:phosphatidylserine/phosphatidylglycerophosphate/cardiolipin synthase-like enzyme